MSLNTNPLAKSVRTGEGILVYATNVLLAITAILPHGLSWTHAGLYLAILNGVHVASRTLLKVVAVQHNVGIGDPIQFDPVDPSVVAGVVADVASTGVLGATGDTPGGPEVTSKPESALKPDPVEALAAPASELPKPDAPQAAAPAPVAPQPAPTATP